MHRELRLPILPLLALRRLEARFIASTLGAGIVAVLLGCGGNRIPAPSNLQYHQNPAVYTQGITISPNAPSSDGGAVQSYMAGQTLPAGLLLDQHTGLLSGTPLASQEGTPYTITAQNAGGSASVELWIRIIVPPSISVQPLSQSVALGERATFSVTALGADRLAYQWSRNGRLLPGATTQVFTTPVTTAGDEGARYRVLVSDGHGNVISSQDAILTLSKVYAGLFEATGSLKAARVGHTATLLADGRVLIAGGAYLPSGTTNFSQLDSLELYDPATGGFTPAGHMQSARSGHTSTLLGNGKVLIAGGAGNSVFVGAELYDPTSGTCSPTGDLVTPRASHTATLLPDGRVLIVGGAGISILTGAECYDPASGHFTATGNQNVARFGHTATLLADGRVLVTGGTPYVIPVNSAELYDPGTGRFSPTGPMGADRTDHTATLLPDGGVLILGGRSDSELILASAERFDPVTETFSSVGSLVTARSLHSAILLPGGEVLVAGGMDGVSHYAQTLAVCELYASGTSTANGTMVTAKYGYTVTLLPDGRVLNAGGYGGTYYGVLDGAELYH